jgi:glutamate dehydrogenase (NAD(P)+)
MTDAFELADDLGPLKVIHVHEPVIGLRAILVVDNVAAGPSIGGLRMAPDVSLRECSRLARAMTFKNAAAQLPHGGGKSVLFGDPRMPAPEKQRLIRALAQALRTEESYIFGPDMGTNEESMAWIRDEIGRSVGLPRVLGGIPLDELGATGFGLRHAAEVAASFAEIELKGAHVAIQGFGAVGRHAARFLAAEGALIVAASDSQGAVFNADGLDVERLGDLKASGQSVTAYPDAQRLSAADLVAVPCDIWIPAARPDVINEENVDRLKARLVLEGANIPATPGAEKRLHERGVLCVPDFIANAGGVICAAMEYRGVTETAAFDEIRERIRRNTATVLERSQRTGASPRDAAMDLARERIESAMAMRRHGIFSGAPHFL